MSYDASLQEFDGQVIEIMDEKDQLGLQIDDGSDFEGNMGYTDEGHAVFIQDGQYMIPIGERAAVVYQDEGLAYERYIADDADGDLTDTNETHAAADQPIVYYATRDFSGDAQSSTKVKGDRDGAGKVPQYSGRELLLAEANSPEGVRFQQPRYQYAILKNGKLHLQTLDIADVIAANQFGTAEEESNERLQEQLQVLQQSIDLTEEEEAAGAPLVTATYTTSAAGDEIGTFVDLAKIVGRNLITGRTVTLNSYVDKLQRTTSPVDPRMHQTKQLGGNKGAAPRARDLLNKRVVVGRTASGKRLIGKILDVRSAAADDPRERSDGEVEPPGANVIVKRHRITRKDFDCNVGKTLMGLMNLESVREKLRDKNLIVKLVDKVYVREGETGSFAQTVSYVYGHMERAEADGSGQQAWAFVLHDQNDAPEGGEGFGPSCGAEDEWSPHSETISLTIMNVIDKSGTKSTRVNLNPARVGCQCHVCSEPFKAAPQTRKHLHRNNKTVKCEVCAKCFASRALLQRHRRVHTDERWYRCTQCSRSFNTAGSLKRHATVHDPSLRPLECTVCTQRFTDESSLRKHLLIHTGIKAYVCEVCDRAFVNQGDLNFHRRIHDPVKQFSCETCGREFSRHSNMVRHEEIHRGGRGGLHCCNMCGCSYSFVSSLTRHIVQKHLNDEAQ